MSGATWQPAIIQGILPVNPAEIRGTGMPLTSSSGFGQLLRRFRLMAGLTQEEMAALAGVSTRGVSDLERGIHATPRPETVRLLADALALPIDDCAALIAAAHPELAAPAFVPPSSPTDAPAEPEARRLSPTPVSLPELIGRGDDLARICALLHQKETRLVTLTGPGGVGKTRLALAVAAELAGDAQFAHGISVVELALVHDPTLLASVLAAALNVKPAGGQPMVDTLKAALRPRAVLLVLDNFEQILSGAPLVSELLASCPDLMVLATSRERLNLRSEREVPVAPLSLPPAFSPADAVPLASLATVPAVRLFVERAVEAQPRFALTADNAVAIATICQRLDGLPLAIELAAAWIRVIPPGTLSTRLSHGLPLLHHGGRDVPARHQTLRGTIAWSHNLLTAGDQALFRRLAVFTGGFTLEAAEAVCGTWEVVGSDPGNGGPYETMTIASAFPVPGTGIHPDDVDVLDGIASLVDKNLVRQVDGSSEAPRFVMLEMIREFGLEQLAAHGEETEFRDRHAVWHLDMVEQAEPVLLRFSNEGGWLHRLEVDQDNLRGALSWSTQTDNAEMALRLAGGLSMFWYFRGRFEEGRHWFGMALSIDASAPRRERAGAHLGLGLLALYKADFEPATASLETALALYQSLNDAWRAAYCLLLLGIVAEDMKSYARATSLLEAAGARAQATGNTALVACVRYHQGVVASAQQDMDQAAACCDEALKLAESSGAVYVARWSLRHLGWVRLQQGNLDRAAALFHQSLVFGQGMGDASNTPQDLTGVGELAVSFGQAARAVRLFGSAHVLREAMGVTHASWVADQPSYERALADARTQLGETAFHGAWEVGRRLSLDEAVADALAITDAIAAGHPKSLRP